MKIALLTNIISPHQLPLAKAIARIIGEENYCYAYTCEFLQDRKDMGWDDDCKPNWCHKASECREFLLDADLVYSGERDIDLIETRLKQGKKTFYVSERWFKPVHGLPGWLRLLHPGYFKMARRFARLFEFPAFRYLPQGRFAANDMALICRIMGRKMPPEKVIPWGYFVEKGIGNREQGIGKEGQPLRILWVGRMIGWKRVDTIIRAVKSLDPAKFSLTLVGKGDKRNSLVRLAEGAPNILFKDSIPIAKIRDEMRANDVYVLSSNGEEGWGAALNEAMEEGMMTLGTFEAGSSSYMLPDSHKFHAGDWRRLADLLQQVLVGKLARIPIGEWSAARAAEKLVEMAK